MIIHIAVHEPDSDSVGGFEWRVDRSEAETEYRRFRGTGGTTFLFTDVTVPKHLTESDQITDWVDDAYWVGGPDVMRSTFGEPTKIHPVTKTGLDAVDDYIDTELDNGSMYR